MNTNGAAPALDAAADSRWTSAWSPVAATLLISLIIKLAAAAVLPLTDDEAYYRMWGEHLRLSYFDHPAMTGVLYWLGDQLPGPAGMVRWPGVLLGQATLLIWLKALAPYFDARRKLAFLALALLSPLVEARAGVFVQPDLPLMFFYALALLLTLRLRQTPSALGAFALGLAMGLGFTSKYMMVIYPLALAPLLLTDSTFRRVVLRALPWIVVGGLIGSAPVWIWNATHDFASFRFQVGGRLGRSRLNWRTPASYVAGQIALLFPTILYWAARDRRLPAVVHYLAWGPLAFFFVVSLWVTVEGKWPSIAALPFCALAAASFPANRRAVQVTGAIWGLALIGAAAVLLIRPPWVSPKTLQTCDCAGLAQATRALSPLYAGTYQTAAQLSLLEGRNVPKLRGMGRMDEYDFLPESRPPATSDRFYVATQKDLALPESIEAQGWAVTSATSIGRDYVLLTVRKNALSP